MTVIAIDWGSIAADHGERVFRVARGIVTDDDSAWDCVQEALLTAVRAVRSEKIDRPVDWLCGVAKNHARHLVRSRGRLRRLLARIRPRAEAPAASASLEDRDALSRALGRLPVKERDAVILRFLAGMTPAGVAASQGISEGAARVRVHRGMKRLRGLLGSVALLTLLTREGVAGGARIRDLVTAARMGSGTAAGAAGFALPWLLQPVGLVLLAVLTAGGAVAVHGLVTSGDGLPEAPVPPAVLAETPEAEGGEKPAVAPRATRKLIVRDLADGKPVQDVALRGVPGKVDRADADGAVTMPVTAIWKTVEVVSDAWTQLGFTGGEKDEDVDLWVHREVRVTGVVRFSTDSPSAQPSDVRLWSDVVVGTRGGGRNRLGVEPWTASWLRRHGIRDRRDHPAPRPDGTFALALPAIRGLILRPYLAKWRGDPVAVPLDPARPATVEIVLRPAIRVLGVLRDENGAPMRGTRLTLWVTKRYRAAEFPPNGALRVPGLGHTASLSEKDDIGAVNYILGMRTEPSGRFSAWVPVEGDALITAFPKGHAPVHHHQGKLESDLIGLTLTTKKVEEPGHLRILRDGQVVSGAEVRFLDLTWSPAGPQPHVTRTADSQGRIKTEHLVTGHRYVVHCLKGRLGFPEGGVLVWEGQSDVDVSKLPDLK